MQMNSAFHERQPIGVKSLSVELTRLRSDLTVLNDLTNDIKMINSWQSKVSLSHTLTVHVVNDLMHHCSLFNNTLQQQNATFISLKSKS